MWLATTDHGDPPVGGRAAEEVAQALHLVRCGWLDNVAAMKAKLAEYLA
jgi:hypothetical protein